VPNRGWLPMRILTRAQLLRYVHDKRALFDAAAARGNPFACSAWVLNFIARVAADDWHYYVAEDPSQDEGCLILYSERGSPHRRFALTNYYASLYTPLLGAAVDREASLTAIAADLTRSRPACAAIDLAPLAPEDEDTAALERAFVSQGWYVKRYFRFGNWHLPCADLSFADYLRARESRVRHTWSRKVKKFNRPDSLARIRIVTAPDEIEAAMDAYEQVYAHSWKPPEPYPEFIRRWAYVCAENGWLRLGLASVADVPIAAQFWFTMQRRAYIFKLAYAQDYAHWSAGTVLTAHLIEHSLEQDRVTSIDYLSGDDPYKQTWMSWRRERIGLIACNLRNPRGALIAAYEYAGALRRRWRRPGVDPAAAPDLV
jgi:hypothetical protein